MPGEVGSVGDEPVDRGPRPNNLFNICVAGFPDLLLKLSAIENRYPEPVPALAPLGLDDDDAKGKSVRKAKGLMPSLRARSLEISRACCAVI